MNRTSTLAAAALVLCAFSGTASAADSGPGRAMTALSVVIANQGNAALVQIRRELAESALDAMKPFLPQAEKAPESPQPARTPVAQR